MKRVEAIVRKEDSEEAAKMLSECNIVYTVQRAEVGCEACFLYSTVVPDDVVDELLDKLSNSVDLRHKENTISVIDVDATISTHLDRLQRKTVNSEARPSTLETVTQPLDRFMRFSPDIFAMVSIATMVALIGLFLNNVATIVGAMLISPLLGPTSAVIVNGSLGRVGRLARAQVLSLSLVVTVIALSFVSTAIMASFARLELTEEIVNRSMVSVVDIAVASLLGAAGGLSLVTQLPEALVGVAIAAALIPPSCVVGIGFAFADPRIFGGAAMLTLSNLLGLELGGILVLRLKGFGPRKYYEKRMARRFSLYSLLVLAAILGLLALLIAYR